MRSETHWNHNTTLNKATERKRRSCHKIPFQTWTEAWPFFLCVKSRPVLPEKLTTLWFRIHTGQRTVLFLFLFSSFFFYHSVNGQSFFIFFLKISIFSIPGQRQSLRVGTHRDEQADSPWVLGSEKDRPRFEWSKTRRWRVLGLLQVENRVGACLYDIW